MVDCEDLSLLLCDYDQMEWKGKRSYTLFLFSVSCTLGGKSGESAELLWFYMCFPPTTTHQMWYWRPAELWQIQTDFTLDAWNNEIWEKLNQEQLDLVLKKPFVSRPHPVVLDNECRSWMTEKLHKHDESICGLWIKMQATPPFILSKLMHTINSSRYNINFLWTFKNLL